MNLIVDTNYREDSLGLEEFVMPIAQVVGGRDDYEIRHYSRVDGKVAAGYERVILSGAPLKDNEFIKRIHAFDWLRVFERPVLGICAGMEAIAAIFGSELVRCQEIGMTEIETVSDNPLFSGNFNAYALHNLAMLPSGEFDVLAKSVNCIQAIKHKSKPTYGVLFHPEVRNTEILDRFMALP